MVKAELKNYRQSPRKVRLVVDLIRGKKVKDAIGILSVTTRRSSLPIKKLVESAIANAKHNFNLESADLFVKEIAVNEGPTMYRSMPRARGSSAPIRKRTSRVLVVLDELKNSKKLNKKIKAVEAEVISESKVENVEKTVSKTTKKVTKTKK
jgi:large subunit ribosomal protein L22